MVAQDVAGANLVHRDLYMSSQYNSISLTILRVTSGCATEFTYTDWLGSLNMLEGFHPLATTYVLHNYTCYANMNCGGDVTCCEKAGIQ